jgi:glutamate synthase (NADPH/NADH) small chain
MSKQVEPQKEKKLKQRTPMRELDAKERIKSFKEVALGYTEDEAVQEASRCLKCKEKPCCSGCPVCVDIPNFVTLVKERKFAEAAAALKDQNSLPAICGRVCPQEKQCEQVCTLGKVKQPIAIGRLERFVADYEREKLGVKIPKIPQQTGKKVAIAGSGPAGLTCASELAKMGHSVKMYESLHVAGGVLMYGIPEFRLPKAIVQAEVDYVKKLGVQIETDALVGRTYTVDELLEDGYDAIFVGSGAGLPDFLGIPGENSQGVYSSNEFLTRTNLMKAYLFPKYDTPIKTGKRVVVVGGSNTAMDSARCALRFRAEKVTIVYRRSEEEMPARREEIERAKEEGVEFQLLTNPTKIIADEKGFVKQIECLKMQLGEPDASGRRRPVPIKGSEFRIDCDTVVIAIGQSPNPLIRQTTKGLEANEIGALVVDPETLMTTRKGIFAGGDIISGGATVIRAMGEGKKAAKAIDSYLKSA